MKRAFQLAVATGMVSFGLSIHADRLFAIDEQVARTEIGRVRINQIDSIVQEIKHILAIQNYNPPQFNSRGMVDNCVKAQSWKPPAGLSDEQCGAKVKRAISGWRTEYKEWFESDERSQEIAEVESSLDRKLEEALRELQRVSPRLYRTVVAEQAKDSRLEKWKSWLRVFEKIEIGEAGKDYSLERHMLEP